MAIAERITPSDPLPGRSGPSRCRSRAYNGSVDPPGLVPLVARVATILMLGPEPRGPAKGVRRVIPFGITAAFVRMAVSGIGFA